MPIPETERSKKYRDEKTKTHTRISPWFINDLIEKIDSSRGELSRGAWIIKVVNEALHPKG